MPGVESEVSAGGIVVRDGRVLIIRARTASGRRVWTFPKGRIEAGEVPEAAARREVREETGYAGRLRTALGSTSYRYRRGSVRVKKTVHWFLFDAGDRIARFNREEVEEVRWVTPHEAYDKLSHQGERALLARAEDSLHAD